MEKIRNLSLRNTIILYMAISLLCSFFLSAVIVKAATVTQQHIWWKYIDMEKYFEVVQEAGGDYVSIPRVSQYDMSKTDGFLSELCDFLETYTVLLLSIAGSCVAVALFYRNKLKTPIKELDAASKMIARNELEFHVTYENQDELGQLCKEFEKMRKQLEENNRTVWRMMEEEKALRGAIAHDLRSPLAVLRGYQEMLLEFVPQETLDKEKITEMLQEGMKQIDRLNRFIETMRKMSALVERELQFADTSLQELGKQIKKEAEILGKDMGKECTVTVRSPGRIVCVDAEVILEVVENLLSNALRYAKEKTEINLACTGQELIISVVDDGQGFRSGSGPSNPKDKLQHSGLGMYISRIYCEKHGGRLLAGNQEGGGAAVEAVFRSQGKEIPARCLSVVN